MKDLIEAIGLTVTEDPTAPRYYQVTFWVRNPDVATQGRAVYDHLTWTEVVDVILSVLDENRPGDIEYVWGFQPKMWDR